MNGLVSIGFLNNIRYQTEIHSHPTWEIIYYTKGSGVNIVEGKEYSFYPGVIICQPPRKVHSEISDSGLQNYHFSVKNFTISSANETLLIQDDINKSFLNILEQLYLEFYKKNNNWLQISEALLAVLNQYMLSWKTNRELDSDVEKFKHILIENIGNIEVEIRQLLQQIPLSNDYFRKKFKQQTGKTPGEYLIDLRIDYAKSLLRNDIFKTIKEVAQQVGYRDQYYFTRLFKKKTGFCPTEWSKQKNIV